MGHSIANLQLARRGDSLALTLPFLAPQLVALLQPPLVQVLWEKVGTGAVLVKIFRAGYGFGVPMSSLKCDRPILPSCAYWNSVSGGKACPWVPRDAATRRRHDKLSK